MSLHHPFLLSLDKEPYYNHDMFPNRMYRQLHARHHHPLDLHTLGMMANLAPNFRHRHPIEANKNALFEVHVDVGLFEPEEVSVKVVNDCLVVEAKHEEREDDHGHISRHFVRRYHLPKDYDPEKIVSTLTADGVLTITAPKPIIQNAENEYVVPIQYKGPNELFVGNNPDSMKNGTMEKKQ